LHWKRGQVYPPKKNDPLDSVFREYNRLWNGSYFLDEDVASQTAELRWLDHLVFKGTKAEMLCFLLGALYQTDPDIFDYHYKKETEDETLN
jgi:hypothetical protein